MTQYPTIDLYATGRNIKRIMKERGFKVSDIQEYLGFSAPQGIYHWFDGRNLPNIDNLYALSILFGVSIDEIICGDGVRENTSGEAARVHDSKEERSAKERASYYYMRFFPLGQQIRLLFEGWLRCLA